MAELDAAVRGINLAIAWHMRVIELRTDSAAVHRWVDDALSGRARLRTKAHGEMLIRRRVDVIRQLVSELELSLTVSLVRSAENHADVVSRVPRDWVRDDSSAAAVGNIASCGVVQAGRMAELDPENNAPHPITAPGSDIVAAAGSMDNGAVQSPRDGRSSGAVSGRGGPSDTADDSGYQQAIAEVHARAGHPGVRRTQYFARREISPALTRSQVRRVVTACDVCRAVDPAPVKWRHGSLDVPETWKRLAIDITHYQDQTYLSIIDCGPSRFCVWRPLRRSDSSAVVVQLEQVFLERGAPEEVLADNDTAFRSREFAAFAARWAVKLRFRAVHRPSGNSIVERNHRSVKVIAARKQCPVSEAVHLYNVTPRDGAAAATAPANGVYRYQVRDRVRPPDRHVSRERVQLEAGGQFNVGDLLWVRKPGSRCTTRSQRGEVTAVVSDQVVEVNGVPWHVRDLRPCSECTDTRPDVPETTAPGEDLPMYVYAPVDTSDNSANRENDGAGRGPTDADVDAGSDGAPGEPVAVEGADGVFQCEPRHSERSRRPPDRLNYGEFGEPAM